MGIVVLAFVSGGSGAGVGALVGGPAPETARPHRPATSVPDTVQDTYDRRHLDWAITVLVGNRDPVRRLAAEAGMTAAS